jgi:hypothetical protein
VPKLENYWIIRRGWRKPTSLFRFVGFQFSNSDLGIRVSAFFRISAFGVRISLPTSWHVPSALSRTPKTSLDMRLFFRLKFFQKYFAFFEETGKK